MLRVLTERGSTRHEGIGFVLQDAPAAAPDLVGPVRQGAEEGSHRLADLGLGAEAGSCDNCCG
jgi:hypothetical protein